MDQGTQPVEPLTRREREILVLLAQDHSNAEIAQELSLAVSSIKWYLQRLYGKLGVNNRRQAVIRAEALGLVGDGRPAPAATPPVAVTNPSPRHNLPLEVTHFFGREAEIVQLRASLAEHRLVTLVGSGGVGKSRLSLRAAEGLVDAYRDGVWLVELASVTNPALVPHQVAATLTVRDEPRQPILETLIHFLRGRQVLLLLDNCEHLLAACAHFADRVLRTCPHVTLLASSREPLGVAGEAVVSVPSLSFPGEDQTPPLEQLEDFPALRLFVDRARLVQPDYQLDDTNAADIIRICQRLDGIPLALELAAARLRLLDTETLAARLDDAFAVLTGGSRTALPRQQTLRATLDWSYRLLNAEERLLLARLSVFARGSTLEAAEAVCGDGSPGDGLEAGQVLERLAALVDKSMVSAERQPGLDTRYFLLETVRQYAREKLNDAGDSQRLLERHLDYYLALAEALDSRIETRSKFAPPPKLTVEQANMRQALQWSFGGQGQLEAGLRLLVAMGPFNWGSLEAGFDLHKRAVALCDSHPAIPALLQARLLECASWYSGRDDPPTTLVWATRGVALSRQLGAAGREILMWNLVALSRCYMGDFEDVERALAPNREAAAILHSLGPDYFGREAGLRVQGYFATRQAEIANRQGRYAEAKDHAAESIRLYEASGSPGSAWLAQVRMGEACARMGEYQAARECFLAVKNVEGVWYPYVLLWLARVDAYTGELARSRDYCRQCIVEAGGALNRNMLATGLGTLALIYAQLGQPVQAARHSGAAAAMYALQKRPPWENSSLDTLFPGWRDGPDAAAIQQAYDAGQAMSSDEAAAFALGDSAA